MRADGRSYLQTVTTLVRMVSLISTLQSESTSGWDLLPATNKQDSQTKTAYQRWSPLYHHSCTGVATLFLAFRAVFRWLGDHAWTPRLLKGSIADMTKGRFPRQACGIRNLQCSFSRKMRLERLQPVHNKGDCSGPHGKGSWALESPSTHARRPTLFSPGSSLFLGIWPCSLPPCLLPRTFLVTIITTDDTTELCGVEESLLFFSRDVELAYLLLLLAELSLDAIISPNMAGKKGCLEVDQNRIGRSLTNPTLDCWRNSARLHSAIPCL